MNQDQSPYAGFRRARSGRAVLNGLIALVLVLLGSAASMPAASARTNDRESAAAWPAEWHAYTYADGTPIGATCGACAVPAPSVSFASDGANAFFRIRLAEDIADTAHGSGGPFVVQIADPDGHVEAVVGVDATHARPDVYVTDALGVDVTTVREPPRHERSRMRVVDAADGSGPFFLDFQVPLKVIATVSEGTVTSSTPIKLYSGSSAATDLAPASRTTINADFMLGDVTAVDFAPLATVRLLAPQHSVTFDSAGGSPVAAQRVSEGFPVAAPARPTRAGHTFGGWYTAESAYDFGAAVTAPTTLVARWRRVRYPLTFDSPGGSAVADQKVLDAKTALLPTAGRATALARSNRSTYSVVFYPNGGSAVSSQAVRAGETASVPKKPTRAGYAFTGWYATPDGDALWDFSSPIDEPGTLYAHWKPLRVNGSPTSGTVAPAADGQQGDTVDTGDVQGDTVGVGEQAGNGVAALPNTGNPIHLAVLPGAVMMLLVGSLLLRRDRRRVAEARDPE